MLFSVEPRPLDLVCPQCGTPMRRVIPKDPLSSLECPNGKCPYPYQLPITYQHYLAQIAAEHGHA